MNLSDPVDVLARTIWRTLDFAPQYEISEFGDVRRRLAGKGAPVGKVLAQTVHHFGYPRVKLTIGGKHKTFEVHYLVAYAFIGPRPFPKAEVRHQDGVPRNVHYSNLSWATHKENEADKFRHGTSSRGEQNGQAKLSLSDVQKIRSIYPSRSLSSLGREFGVSVSTVSHIVNRQSWAWT